MGPDTPLWLIMTLQGIRGMGVSTLIGPLVSWGLSGLGHDVMVDGSAFFTTVRQACASFGTALMMACIIMSGGVAGSVGYQVALGLSALFAVAVLVCALASFLGQRRSHAAEGEREQIEDESAFLKADYAGEMGDNDSEGSEGKGARGR